MDKNKHGFVTRLDTVKLATEHEDKLAMAEVEIHEEGHTVRQLPESEKLQDELDGLQTELLSVNGDRKGTIETRISEIEKQLGLKSI